MAKASIEDNKTALVLIERHLVEIEVRIVALKTVIEKTEAAGRSATNQLQLLSDMGAALRTVIEFRAKVLSNANINHGSTAPRVLDFCRAAKATQLIRALPFSIRPK